MPQIEAPAGRVRSVERGGEAHVVDELVVVLEHGRAQAGVAVILVYGQKRQVVVRLAWGSGLHEGLERGEATSIPAAQLGQPVVGLRRWRGLRLGDVEPDG